MAKDHVILGFASPVLDPVCSSVPGATGAQGSSKQTLAECLLWRRLTGLWHTPRPCWPRGPAVFGTRACWVVWKTVSSGRAGAASSGVVVSAAGMGSPESRCGSGEAGGGGRQS